jgi:hypothetical protein
MAMVARLFVSSLAELESELERVQLWALGPGKTRVEIPACFLDRVAAVLLSDIVGEAPFQSWGASFVIDLHLGELPNERRLPPNQFALFPASDLYTQQCAGAPSEVGDDGPPPEGVFGFDVLCSVSSDRRPVPDYEPVDLYLSDCGVKGAKR